MKTQTKHTIKS